jgi:Flp pilus assembly protein TadD
MAGRADAQLMQQAVRHYKEGRLGAAETLCKQILTKTRKDPEVHSLLGHVALRLHHLDEAVRCFRQCVTLCPKVAKGHVYLGEALLQVGKYREALDRFDKALKLEPGLPRALAAKADLHFMRANYDKARAVIDREVKAGRGGAELAAVLADVELESGNRDRAIEIGAPYLDATDLQDGLRRRLGFAVGKAYERTGRPDEAFAAYQVANRGFGARFDPVKDVARTDSIIEAYSRERMPHLPRSSETSEVPVFIVGMPRCGSTLAERILDAHPAVHGAGEIGVVYERVRSVSVDIGSSLAYPECVADLEPADVDRFGAEHVKALRAYSHDATRIVDKNLQNYLHLGLIALMLPRARVIHCRRDPVNTCLSCYTVGLQPTLHPYAADLAHLGLVYRQYVRIMEHWAEVLDLERIDVDYETMVADQEGESRRIIEFCGLEWDDACLRFHESGRDERTLSHAQVRKPIYTSSLDRAGRFASHLGPLREALGDLVGS